MRKYGPASVKKDHGKWRAVAYYHDAAGKRHAKGAPTPYACSAKGNKNKQLAIDWANEWRDGLIAAEQADAERPAANDLVQDYAEKHIEALVATGAAKPRTTDGYKSYLRCHIIGTPLGTTPICDVHASDVEAWIADLSNDVCATSVSKTYVFLKSVFQRAVRCGDLPKNPCDAVKAPKRRRRPVNTLDRAGRDAMLGKLDALDDQPLKVAATIAVRTGMRIGEICGLRWVDVDLDAREIHVNHALSKKRGGFYLSSPKTESSRRTIPMGANLAAVMGARKAEQRAEAMAGGFPWSEKTYVVGSPITGRPASPTVLERQWKMWRDMNHVVGSQAEPLRFHDLRHTFATLAIAAGIDVKTVSAIMGHSSVAMTIDLYAGVLESSKRQAMDLLDA